MVSLYSIILPSAPWPSKRYLCLTLSNKNPVCIFFTRIRATGRSYTKVMSGEQCTVHIMQLSSSLYIFLQISVSSSEHQRAYYSLSPSTYTRFQVLQPLLKLQISWFITPCRLTLPSSSGSRSPTTEECWSLQTMAPCPFGMSVKMYKSTRRNKPENFNLHPQLISSLHVTDQVSRRHLISPSMTLI